MATNAVLFPGQGSQYVEMGRKLYNEHQTAKRMYDEAIQIAGFDLLGRDLKNPSQDIFQTTFAQPAILTLSVIAFHVFQEKHAMPFSYMAGHSLRGIFCFSLFWSHYIFRCFSPCQKTSGADEFILKGHPIGNVCDS